MRFASRIWEVLGRDRKLMIYSVLLGLTFTGLSVIPPLLIREMILWLRRPVDAGSFWWLGTIVAAVYVLRGITRYLYGLCSHIAAYRTLHRLAVQVYEHIQSLPPSYTTKRHSGNLVARSLGDVEAIEDYIAHGIPESMLAVLVPTTLSVVLLLINWQLALIALLPLPLLGVLVYLVTSRTRNAWRGVRSRFAEISARIQDHLSGLSVIQSFVREGEMTARLRVQSREYRDRIIYANTWSLVPAGVVECASGAGLVLLVWSAGWIRSSTDPAEGLHVDVADLVVLLMYLGQIVLPFLRLANLTENLQKSAASAERVFALLDTPSTITSPASPLVPEAGRYDIELANVDFSYDGSRAVFQDTSFRIETGESVALVGVTGVGKSTLCHLIVRFYDVQDGVIRIGGVDVRRWSLTALRQQVALVPQDVFLFEGTIRENLLIGQPQATSEELEDACRVANAHAFIADFPDGYDTRVGERGVRLSGGQKQRIAIARALLKDAPILILDEATSAVDAETEGQIKDALQRVTKGRTVLIVAHRQSTIQSADRILVLERGRIVQSGSYAELSAIDGPFTRLCQVRQHIVYGSQAD